METSHFLGKLICVSISLGCVLLSRVGVLPASRLFNQSHADRLGGHLDASRGTVNHGSNPLDVGLELPLGLRCDLDTNTTKVLGATPVTLAVSGLSAGSKKMAYARHGQISKRKTRQYTHIQQAHKAGGA